jgi:hypothetical protein
MTRLYVPATPAALAELDGGGLLETSEAFVAADESEEAEYAALVAAAEASSALVSGLGDGQRRRVVVVADVQGEPTSITIGDVASVHADPGDDADTDEDLGWYATQEIPGLIGGN